MSYKGSDEELFGDQNYDLSELEEITIRRNILDFLSTSLFYHYL